MSAGIKDIKHIIAVASGKGGVGKSTVAINLAIALEQLGHKVGLMDGDLYGPSQTTMMGASAGPTGDQGVIVPAQQHGIKFVSMGAMNPSGKAVIMRAPLAVRAISQFLTGVRWGTLDYLIIDLPPGTGDIQLTLAQQANLAGAVIVTTPQKVATEIARKGLEMFQTLNVPILGVVENMSGFNCSSCGALNQPFHGQGGAELAQSENTKLLGQIPLDPELMLAGDDGIPVLIKDKNLASAKAFLQLASEVEQALATTGQSSLEPEKINVYEGSDRFQVLWKDGSNTECDAFSLRFNCPCANCVDETTGVRMIKAENIATNIKFENIRPVGRYGIQIHFSDGHNTGIFRYDKIKEQKFSSSQQVEI